MCPVARLFATETPASLATSVLLLAALSGWGKAATSADVGETAKSGDAVEITVTFMNGEEQLGAITAKAGELLAEADYEACYGCCI